MNILLTTETYFPYITGVSVSTDNIARFMLSRGHSVTLICPEPVIKGNFYYPKGLKIIRIPSFRQTFYNNNAIAIPWLAWRIVKNEIDNTKFDVIHVQETGITGLAALYLAKKHKIPVVGSLHFIPEQIDRVLWGGLEKFFTPILKSLMYLFFNKYDQLMTVSNYFAAFLKSINIKKPINVISNGVDTTLFRPRPLDLKTRSKYGFSKNDFVFFYLGRLDLDKNVVTIVRAMPKTDTNVKLLVVGKGTENKFLLNLTKKLNIENKISWISYVTDKEMLKLYSSINAFCIMSPYEGQSIVTLQAIATGLPVIAANAGALPELVRDNVNGFLIKTYDYKNLAGRMNLLSKSKALCKKFGIASRKISLQHERSKALLKLEEIYIMLQHV